MWAWVQLKQDVRASGQLDPLPKLTQASDTDVRIIVGKNAKLRAKLNSRIRGRSPGQKHRTDMVQKTEAKKRVHSESVLFLVFARTV